MTWEIVGVILIVSHVFYLNNINHLKDVNGGHMEIKNGIIKALTNKGYGYIEQDDRGVDLYFHANDLVNGKFDYLKAGVKVQYIERITAKGINAKSIIICNRQGKYNKIKYI